MNRWVFFVFGTLLFVLSNLILWSSHVVTEEGNGDNNKVFAQRILLSWLTHLKTLKIIWCLSWASQVWRDFCRLEEHFCSSSPSKGENTEAHLFFSFVAHLLWFILTSHWTLKAKMQRWVHVTRVVLLCVTVGRQRVILGGCCGKEPLAGGLLPSFPVSLPPFPDTLQELCGKCKSGCLVTPWVWSEAFSLSKAWRIWLGR